MGVNCLTSALWVEGKYLKTSCSCFKLLGLLQTIFQGETTDTYTQVTQNRLIKMGKGAQGVLEHEMSFLMICKVYPLGCRGINGLGREMATIKGLDIPDFVLE